MALLNHVKQITQRIDQRSMNASQLGETLAVLNQTSIELKKACQGIAEYTNALGQVNIGSLNQSEELTIVHPNSSF